MDFRITEEQELIVESVRQLFEQEAPESYIRECDEKHIYPERLAKAYVDYGFAFLGLPEEVGGTPCDAVTQMLVMEEVCRSGAPGYLFNNAITIDDIVSFGSKIQVEKALEAARTGFAPLSLMITEPQAGSDDANIMTTATRRNGKVYLNGTKTFITSADQAPYMLVVTRDVENPNPHRAMSMWMIPNDLPGITMSKLDKLGNYMTTLNEVYLDNVECEESDLLGVENNGFMQLMKNFEIERLLAGANSLGMAEAAFEDAARFANQRVAFGRPIGSNQLIQEKITSMQVKLENMRNLTYKTAWKKDNGLPLQIDSALVKYYCPKAAFEVIDDAMQILGGLGYTGESRVGRLWRDVRLGRIGGGTEEIMVYITGRAILKQYQ